MWTREFRGINPVMNFFTHIKHIASGLMCAVFICLLFASSSLAAVSAVPTFQSLGLYWNPAEASASNPAQVQYRKTGSLNWKSGLDLWFDARNGEYRGSLVQLDSGTQYEIKLTLGGTSVSTTLTAATWNETFPIGNTVTLPVSSANTLFITESGSPSGYVLYAPAPGSQAVIDVNNNQDFNISIDASYVIIRGLTLKGAGIDGIRISENSHHIVFEENDISGWGSANEYGYGTSHDAGIKLGYGDHPAVTNLIIQRNTIHHPRYDTNNWDECNPAVGGCDCNGLSAGSQDPGISCHPAGPEPVHLYGTGGNHVIRYNTIYSDEDHKFNDGLGAGPNFSDTGFPNRDSDIYGNYITHTWDDGIESEGANTNVRVWGNFLDHCLISVAVAATHVGPIYVWRNVSGRSYVSPGIGGYSFLKSFEENGFGGGLIYVFHNTILQDFGGPGHSQGVPGEGPYFTRNNILHTRGSSIKSSHPDNDFDYDLYNNSVSASGNPEPNGINGVPEYQTYSIQDGFFQTAASLGIDAGTPLPNFSDGFTGSAPDMGAYETGLPVLEFGVDAYSTPTPPSITQQPADQSADEGQTATFTVSAKGSFPLAYQWRLNGTDISGAIDPSYATPLLTRADSGALYSVFVSNAFGSVTSQNATITVIPDTTPPSLISVSAPSNNQVKLLFSESLEPASAETVSNYAMDQGVSVSGSVLSSPDTVTLTSSQMTVGVNYTLTVNNVKDISGNTIAANSQASFVYTDLKTTEIRVAAGSDDAEESSGGSVNLGSSDLELVNDGSDQTVGMRFVGVNVPRNAVVLSATIQFTVDEAQSIATALTIQGETTDNAGGFTTSSQNISSRSRTNASLSWDPVTWNTVGEAGADQRTPDLAPLLQEIFNRPGWVSGNALSIIVTGTGHRTADSYDGSPAGAPLLHIEYSGGGASSGTQPPAAPVGFSFRAK